MCIIQYIWSTKQVLCSPDSTASSDDSTKQVTTQNNPKIGSKKLTLISIKLTAVSKALEELCFGFLWSAAEILDL